MITLINHQGLKVMHGIQLHSPAPSIGLAYIGAYLKQNGLDYQAIDACGLALDRILPYEGSDNIYVQGLSVDEVVERIGPGTKIVGMTCLFSHCWPLVVRLVREIRRTRPGVFLVAGGEHPTALPQSALDDDLFEVVVAGEGEETFLELSRAVLGGQPWKAIHGLIYRENGNLVRNPDRRRVLQIDGFPQPDWEPWCIEAYIAHHQMPGINLGRQMPILGSRGCPYDCKFCSNAGMWTRKYLMRDPQGLVDEMESMKRKYRVDSFTFMDSTFVVDRKKTLAFAKELIARKTNITYQLPAGTRCEAFDDELAEALSDSGLRNFAFAPESGSTEILAVIRKQIDLGRFERAVRTVLKTRMTVCCFIVIGVPEETPATLQQTLQLLRKLAWLGVHDVTVSQFTPYPGSDYFRELWAAGRLSRDLTELKDVIDFYSPHDKSYAKALTPRQLYRWMLWLYVNFYVLSFVRRPFRLLKNLWEFLARGVENTRYMRLLKDLLVKRRHWRKVAIRPCDV